MPTRRIFDCEDSEYEKFQKYVIPLQIFESYCSNNECILANVTIFLGEDLFLKRDHNENVNFGTWLECSECSAILCRRFIRSPPWLIVQPLYDCLENI